MAAAWDKPFRPLESFPVDRPWFAIRLRDKLRGRAEQLLEAQGAVVFSPYREERRAWSDREKALKVPLFPGYTFGSFAPELRWQLGRTPGVIDIVKTRERLTEIAGTELEAIWRANAADPTMVECDGYPVGSKVRVVSGPMRGNTGVLVECRSQMRLVLAVTMMNRNVSVQVNGADVELLADA